MLKPLFYLQIILILMACNKATSDTRVALAPSATVTTVGRQISVVLTSATDAVKWMVSPDSNVIKKHGITTGKLNYFTFSRAGTYTISVRTHNLTCDAALFARSPDSCWAGSIGSSRATLLVDSAFIVIQVNP